MDVSRCGIRHSCLLLSIQPDRQEGLPGLLERCCRLGSLEAGTEKVFVVQDAC